MMCDHRVTFVTMAYVPAGVACIRCDLLLMQYLPEPPERLGYLSADWAWKHRDGKEWTTQRPESIVSGNEVATQKTK